MGKSKIFTTRNIYCRTFIPPPNIYSLTFVLLFCIIIIITIAFYYHHYYQYSIPVISRLHLLKLISGNQNGWYVEHIFLVTKMAIVFLNQESHLIYILRPLISLFSLVFLMQMNQNHVQGIFSMIIAQVT